MTELAPIAVEPGTGRRPTTLELFSGVGGFHLALDRAGFDVIWSNQWEPSTREQHAFRCYERHVADGDFQAKGRWDGLDDAYDRAWRDPVAHVADNRDIARVLDEYEAAIKARGRRAKPLVPDADLVVGGFPCQDYSVARTLRQAHGLVGQKGVLWWEIHRLLRLKLETGRPIRWLFLENVDRLLKSPASQRGRDFAVMLASLADLGYEVEWRVVNAADYGFPQKRRRVFIVGRYGQSETNPLQQLRSDGVLARALPADLRENLEWTSIPLGPDVKRVSDEFGAGSRKTAWGNAGVMRRSDAGRPAAVWTTDVTPVYDGRRDALADILTPSADVAPEFFVGPEDLPRWQFLKGAKSLQRVNRSNGIAYSYDEGAIPFPDATDGPSRTILTGEGGATPSRFKHIIRTEDGRFRRLTPRELEFLNGFPGDWTAGMSDGRRAFMMGNALVVGVVERIADVLVGDIVGSTAPTFTISASH
jgi:DNA (cytosine-5)-methyltransferase 1